MRIVAIELERLRLPLDPPFCPAWDAVPRRHFDATLVVVRTDEGITGYGSGDTMDGFEVYAELFIGTDPLRIARHVRTLDQIAVHAGRYWPLEAALWDILGQVTGQPASVLLGGATRRLPAYASFGQASTGPARAETAAAAKAAGFRAMKIRIDRTNVGASLAAIRATRAAVGDDIALMADLNQWWRMPGDLTPALDLAAVRRIAAELADLGVLWLEEPLPAVIGVVIPIDKPEQRLMPNRRTWRTAGLGGFIPHAPVAAPVQHQPSRATRDVWPFGQGLPDDVIHDRRTVPDSRARAATTSRCGPETAPS